MSHHHFPSPFSSPLPTPSPTKERQFSAFPFPAHASQLASSEAAPRKSQPSTDQATSSNPPESQHVPAKSYRAPDSKRISKPRLSSLQSLNSTPASPSLTEQDSGRAFISTSRFHTSHPSMARSHSRNALETLQPLAESSETASKHNLSANSTTTSPPIVAQPWTKQTAESSSALPPRPRRSSTSPKLESALSEFGQMGAPYAENDRNGASKHVSAKLRNFQSSTGAFLRRSHTVTSGISSAAQKKTQHSHHHHSPPSSNAVTYGPSSGKHAPKLSQRRQTVSSVSPTATDRQPGAANSSISPASSRTLQFAQQSPHPLSGSTLSLTCPASHIRQRATLPNNQLEAKVVILGSQGVGKTSLVHRYTSGQFAIASTPSTIGASFLTKKLIVDGVKVRLQLWDTAGQERFRSMAPMYYRGSHAAVIVYDITSMSSFMDIQAWIEELKKNMSTDLLIHVVGAKADLAWSSRQVDLDFARATVRSWLQPYSTQLAAAWSNFGFNNVEGSSASPTRPSSRLSGLGSLAVNSASRFTAFQRGPLGTTSTSTSTLATIPAAVGIKPSSFTSSTASTGSANSDAGRDASLPNTADFDISWEIVEISEVSAKDDCGIEEVFLAVTKKLVERTSQIEQQRLHRERNSIFLSASEAEQLLNRSAGAGGAIITNSWSCCA
ncbi:hypothetical protein NDA18_000226 [Ustilago nuda]|nr:hypothetical protein NDA18_000226 [Ustilago nuda]